MRICTNLCRWRELTLRDRQLGRKRWPWYLNFLNRRVTNRRCSCSCRRAQQKTPFGVGWEVVSGSRFQHGFVGRSDARWQTHNGSRPSQRRYVIPSVICSIYSKARHGTGHGTVCFDNQDLWAHVSSDDFEVEDGCHARKESILQVFMCTLHELLSILLRVCKNQSSICDSER